MADVPAKLSLSIFDPTQPFIEKARSVFEFQVANNPVYRRFAFHFIPAGELPETVDDIPLLPIRAFKECNLVAEGFEPELTFKSSGTGKMDRSSHHVVDLDLYRRSILQGFSQYFNSTEFTLLCYAPGYSDNPDSSLLWMLQYLVDLDKNGQSRFLPLGQPLRSSNIKRAVQNDRQIVLFGAAFGLLDLLDLDSLKLPGGSHIIETGGMKTHRREMSKTDLRYKLANGFDVPLDHIHSEYGMCELMSQLYAIGDEWFEAPGWVHASVRDPLNPARPCDPGEEGKVAIMDLANLYSCPFILTDDRGVINEEGKLAVLGRWHSAALRGCNFLIDRD
ncbi:LuxE/PaaK family acyltransferase [Rhodohalobacter sp. 8-1]|uniref:LuxE/PaaK family acyltransferase n=1 Tax=Rhodohalobacter sp. 8-1 TaxID=3131972 RepID=UPI0030ED8642